MYYKPDPDHAYSSIQHITNDIWAGWLVRGMHRWGASVFIILMFMHMGRVFLFGAYKYPRELNWIIGVLLLAMGLGEGFTGYLLPWDQTAYWATVVGININGTAPFLGPFLAQFLQGGTYINADTLSRFYAIHMLLIPGRDHRADRAAPVSRHPARRHLAAVVEGGRGHGPDAERQRSRPRRRGRHALRHQRAPLMASDRIVERRRVFQQYKEDVKERGKPFYPYAMFHDTMMSLVVVVRDHRPRGRLEVLDAGQPHGHRGGLAREALRRAGRPGDDQLRPAAGLVLLLPLLPAPDLQVAGDGDPRHDRHPDDLPRAAARDPVHRHPLRAPPARAARSRSSRRSSSSSRWACSPTRARRRRRHSARS